MGRRNFRRMRMRGGRASSSTTTLECPFCHTHVFLNEYRAHIINCRDKSQNNNPNPVIEEPIDNTS